MDEALIAALRLKIGENICGKVALEKKALLVKDIESDERFQKKGDDKYETKSFICCPILMQDSLLGVLNISDKKDATSFTEDELDLITILANQAAITLENARLMSELRSKTVELEEINKGLIDSDMLKTELLARLSHELRTPLNSIRGAIYYLKEKEIDSKIEQEEFFEIISDETNKLAFFLEGLLDFSRVEKEGDMLRKKIINIADIIKDVISTKAIKNFMSDRKVFLLLSSHEHVSDIIGDKTRIFQMFMNLIEGSTKYISSGDSIEVSPSETESAVEVEFYVKNGHIPENELSFIFDSLAMWSLPDTSSKNLKFYLAKKTAELHKGTISIQNTPEGFFIKLAIPKSLKERRDAEMSELMDTYLSFAAKSMDLNQCSLMLTDELTGALTIKSAYGIDEDVIRATKLKLGEKIAGWVAIEKKPLLIEDIEKDVRFRKKNNPQYNTKSLLSMPVIVNDEVVGVLNLNNKENGKRFNTRDLYLASAIASRISQIFEKLRKGDLKGKDFKIVSREMEALLHARRKDWKQSDMLMDLVFHVMKDLGCSDEEIGLGLYASALYDLGLTQIDDSILKKRSKLSALEQRIIKTHPFSGAGLIDNIEFSDEMKKIILHHHERYDGSGYPDGLKGDSIPFISRILGVVDTYMAMITDQYYRKALSRDDAIKYIMSESGSQFDPKVANAFGAVISGYPL
jgi:response regulator RpfG family c-di-GMP phosphodiesterase/signal transduction histidine kinase